MVKFQVPIYEMPVVGGLGRGLVLESIISQTAENTASRCLVQQRAFSEHFQVLGSARALQGWDCGLHEGRVLCRGTVQSLFYS